MYLKTNCATARLVGTHGRKIAAAFCVCAVLCISVLSCATTSAAASTKKYEPVAGVITAVEKYGHLVTDVPFELMQKWGYEHGDIVKVYFENAYKFTAPIVKKYEVDKGKQLVRTEYADGNIAFCINYGNLAQESKLGVGDKFIIYMKEKGGYSDDFEALDVTRTDNRADYSDDATFANFREVTFNAAIAPNTLYRGSHPTKTRWPRAPYVSALMEKAGIATVINMSDSEDQLKNTYLAESNQYASAYYKKLADAGNVICLAMDMDFTGKVFTDNIIKALRFMIDHSAPYYIHCNEGKDRTGFMFILLGALTGADEKTIYDDYMKTYKNFYHVASDSRKYNLILQKNAVPMLNWVTMNRHDRAQAAEEFLIKNGMAKKDVEALKAKLMSSK